MPAEAYDDFYPHRQHGLDAVAELDNIDFAHWMSNGHCCATPRSNRRMVQHTFISVAWHRLSLAGWWIPVASVFCGMRPARRALWAAGNGDPDRWAMTDPVGLTQNARGMVYAARESAPGSFSQNKQGSRR
jgi:hypothetical protein